MNEILIKARERKGITRKELAEILKISFSMVEKVERGVRRASPDLAKKWGDELGIKESQIYRYFFVIKPDNMCQSDVSNNDLEVIDQQAATLPKTG
ncbi:helix-turn-helix transcriptional regulator [Sporomusa sp.]|uniref:helix-turn-helix domain-containing protein n=1 Tax=Sporomusa sp. TaxID=2078658 RepID=UPI002BEC595E|nr:helix-turn-helix transcriptional regulator [Sporomusa sp.]HWR06178.1 helix-turn-helix transcriptional regulator [Sporomusa sp.]